MLLLCAVAGGPATAQFRRGILAESTEIMLFPAVPPRSCFRRDVPGRRQESVDRAGAAPQPPGRCDYHPDRRRTTHGCKSAEGKPDMTIVATLTEWTRDAPQGTRYVSETRQIGTKQVTDKKGNKRTEPIYEYGRNKPTVIDEGAAAVRLEVRRGTQVLADETARFTYQRRSPGRGRPALNDRSRRDDAGSRGATRRGTGDAGARAGAVLLARSDEVDKLNDLARTRKWNEWRAALQETRPHRDAKRDAYRLHNIGVAHEALAYEATTDDETQQLMNEAAAFVQQAIAAQ